MIQEDTISAVSTALGEGGIGIIRLSGTKAVAIAAGIFRGAHGKTVQDIASHQAAYGHIIDPAGNQMIDEVLLLVMRAPRSYTREDVVEIHCHGGPVPVRKILALTLAAGARLAEPGEFTKRAFLNGRLDLTRAEAVIDVIRAKTDASLKMAAGNLSGKLADKIHMLRNHILEMIAHLEAAIDFPEDDIEELAAEDVERRVKKIGSEIEELLAGAHTGRILRDGLETVIIGKPNVGKSSLLNVLLKETRAIVTDVPGTTRDSIEEYANIGGIPLKIIDTAGIRETRDVVEKIGVEKAKSLIQRADLVLLVLDSSSPLTHEDQAVLELLTGCQTLVLVNKSDLNPVLDLDRVMELLPGKKLLKISILEGTGLEELEQYIIDMVYGGQIQLPESGFVNNVRQEDLLVKVNQSLREVLATIAAGLPPDCIVVDLRSAWEQLGRITGDTIDEDIIDQIFTQFCIGK